MNRKKESTAIGPGRIAMAVSNDLLTDRRVWRNANELCRLGHDVHLTGVLKGRLENGERRTENGDREKGNPSVAYQHTWASHGALFYAEYNVRLFFRMMHERCDIMWSNDADTLPAMALAARLRRKPLVADMHEIMSEVPEVQGRPRVQRAWRWVERTFLPWAWKCYTESESYAEFYMEHYGVSMIPLRNMGVEDATVAPGEGALPAALEGVKGKVLLYQGAVNKGRGVDWAIDALEYLPDCNVVVAGVGDEFEQMKQYAASKPWADRVLFLGRLEPQALVPVTRRAAVGLVMLEDLGPSYRLSLPNRVGDFVRAGVPIVVSDMPEMGRVVQRFGVGEVIGGLGPKPLAEAVRRVLDGGPWPEERFAEARHHFDWNQERKKLDLRAEIGERKEVNN